MSGIKIPIQADVSGVKSAMQELVEKANQITATLGSGKAKLDTSSAKKSMQELEGLVGKLHKSLENASNVDIGDKALDGLTDQFEGAVKEANDLAAALQAVGVQAAGGFSKSATATRSLIRELERARRLQQVMAREGQSLPMASALNAEREFQRKVAAGVPGSSKFRNNNGLASVAQNWRDLAMNETDARRRRRELLRSVGIDHTAGVAASSGAAAAGRGGVGGPVVVRPSFGSYLGSTALQAGRGVLGAALPSGGLGGSIAHNAVSSAAATEGGMFSGGGLARLAGGAAIGGAAYLGIRAVSAVKGRINAAEGEGGGYADMSRTMGVTAVDFNGLRDAVRAAASGMALAYEESQKLAQEYARQTGAISLGDLSKEVRGAAGFSRGMGIDPAKGADFFGTLRHNKVSGGDADNRRIALMMADAIGKAGVFHKTDEVLQAVSAFTVQATRASFSSANIGGYMGGMGALMGTGLPGMDPSAAASLLAKADGAIRGGGSLAAQNFMLGTAQQAMPDINATEIGFLRDGGAFGSAQSAFGEGSAFQKMAANDPALRAKGLRMAKQGGSTTNIERFMKGAKQFGAGTIWTKENLKGLMGFSDSEAAAFMAADGQSGGIGKSLEDFKSAGFDPATMKMSAVKGMMTTKYGSDADRRGQAKYLQGLGGADKLSDVDGAALAAALANPGKDDGKLKEVLTRLVATKDMELTEGDRSRQSMKDVENATTAFATKLIPIAIAIREGIVGVAKHFGVYKDTVGNSDKAKAALAAGAQDGAGRRQALGKLFAEVRDNPDNYTPEFREEVERMFNAEGVNAPEAGQGASGRRGGFEKSTNPDVLRKAGLINKASPYDAMFKRAAEKYGVDWKDLKQIAVHESGLRASAVGHNKDGSADRGIMQLNSRYDDERGVSNPFDPEQNIMAGAGVWARALKKSGGNRRDAFRRYNGAGPRAEWYGDHMMELNAAANGGGSIPMPGGASTAPAAATHNVRIGGSAEVTVKMPDGTAQAVPFNVTQMGSPKVSGTGSPFAGAMR